MINENFSESSDIFIKSDFSNKLNNLLNIELQESMSLFDSNQILGNIQHAGNENINNLSFLYSDNTQYNKFDVNNFNGINDIPLNKLKKTSDNNNSNTNNNKTSIIPFTTNTKNISNNQHNISSNIYVDNNNYIKFEIADDTNNISDQNIFDFVKFKKFLVKDDDDDDDSISNIIDNENNSEYNNVIHQIDQRNTQQGGQQHIKNNFDINLFKQYLYNNTSESSTNYINLSSSFDINMFKQHLINDVYNTSSTNNYNYEDLKTFLKSSRPSSRASSTSKKKANNIEDENVINSDEDDDGDIDSELFKDDDDDEDDDLDIDKYLLNTESVISNEEEKFLKTVEVKEPYYPQQSRARNRKKTNTSDCDCSKKQFKLFNNHSSSSSSSSSNNFNKLNVEFNDLSDSLSSPKLVSYRQLDKSNIMHGKRFI